MASMTRQLNQLGLPFERFPCVVGRNLSQEEFCRRYDDRLTRLVLCRSMTPGEVGAALTNLEIYTRMIRDNIPYAMILEDDVIIQEGFCETLEAITSWLDAGRRQIFLLSEDLALQDTFPLANGAVAGKLRAGSKSSAYIITQRAARAVLQWQTPVRGLPDQWNRMMLYGLAQIYGLAKPVAVQDQVRFASSIGEARFHLVAQAGIGRVVFKLKRVIGRSFDWANARHFRQAHPQEQP